MSTRIGQPGNQRTARVDINLLWLIPGRVGGSEEYTVGLLDALTESKDGADFKVRLFCQPGLVDSHPRLAQAFEVFELPARVAIKPLRFASESSWLAARTSQADLVHHGGGVLPYGGRLLSRGRSRSVVTIHDVQPLDLPENFSAVQQRWFSEMLPRAGRKADHIITPSQFTASRVTELLSVEPAAITVVSPVHVGSGPEDGEAGRSCGAREPIADLAGVDFLLLPAMAHHHKRHVDAIEALDRLRDRHPQLALVLSGAEGQASEEILARRRDLALESRVHIVGRVDVASLRWLFDNAAALVFPSTYEGFGNPLLEAMVAGIPVVTADIPASSEVTAGAAMLVPPRDPDALAAAIANLLDDEQLRRDLIERGRRRVAEFTAEVSAQQLITAYRRALA